MPGTLKTCWGLRANCLETCCRAHGFTGTRLAAVTRLAAMLAALVICRTDEEKKRTTFAAVVCAALCCTPAIV